MGSSLSLLWRLGATVVVAILWACGCDGYTVVVWSMLAILLVYVVMHGWCVWVAHMVLGGVCAWVLCVGAVRGWVKSMQLTCWVVCPVSVTPLLLLISSK